MWGVGGAPAELRCSYDPDTLGKNPVDGRKVKGVIHWVSAQRAVALEVRLFDRLFNQPDPGAAADFRDCLNPDSLSVIRHAFGEPMLAAQDGEIFQFERLGYFCRDVLDSSASLPVFNRSVTLRDSWARLNTGQENSR